MRWREGLVELKQTAVVGLVVACIASAFVGCQLMRAGIGRARDRYPTYAEYEDAELRVCASIIARDHFKIVIANRTDAGLVADFRNAFYLNSYGDCEYLSIVSDGGGMRRHEYVEIGPRETRSLSVYPEPITVGMGGKGMTVTSHDERSYKVPYPSQNTQITIPVVTAGQSRVIDILFRPGVFIEEAPTECQ